MLTIKVAEDSRKLENILSFLTPIGTFGYIVPLANLAPIRDSQGYPSSTTTGLALQDALIGFVLS